MLLTEMLVWENTEQELVVCGAINLIYELRALIWRTDWQDCEERPTFLRKCERQLTCFDRGLLCFSQIWYDGGGQNVNESQGWNSYVLKHPRKLHFLHFLDRYCLFSLARSHGNFTLNLSRDEKTGSVVVKTVEVCVRACTLVGLLPCPDVYSLMAHSKQELAFEVSTHSANILQLKMDIKMSQGRGGNQTVLD